MNKQCGIYEIFNMVNGKSYVGQSTNITQRLSKHKSELRHNKHQNLHLQNAWNKYGEYNFIFNVIEYCDIDELDDIEKYYINIWNLTNNQYGYNVESGGNLNKTLSTETKRKMSEAHKGKALSAETRKKMSEARNTTGFYRVSKDKDSTCKQGFRWRYQYQYKSTKKQIKSTNLLKLKEKVEAQNLPWKIIDEEKAQKSLKKDIGD